MKLWFTSALLAASALALVACSNMPWSSRSSGATPTSAGAPGSTMSGSSTRSNESTSPGAPYGATDTRTNDPIAKQTTGGGAGGGGTGASGGGGGTR